MICYHPARSFLKLRAAHLRLRREEREDLLPSLTATVEQLEAF